jgi:hypothetical protein
MITVKFMSFRYEINELATSTKSQLEILSYSVIWLNAVLAGGGHDAKTHTTK